MGTTRKTPGKAFSLHRAHTVSVSTAGAVPVKARSTVSGFTGLFGFVFVRPIYKPRFWLSVLVVLVVWELFLYPALSDYNTDLMKDFSGIESIFLKTFEWLIMLPWLFALYLYGKPCNPAWQKNLKTLQ